MASLITLGVIIILAWFYDFWNGANDCANAIATTVSTRALSFRKALLLSSFFNLLGAFISTEVAKTIGRGIVKPEFVSFSLLVSALVSAVIWTVVSTRLGIPISVTHALVGGLVGAAIVSAGFGSLISSGIIKIVVGMVFTPIFGFIFSIFLVVSIARIIRLFFKKMAPAKVFQSFRIGQIFSASAVALSHGMNDTQNAMGVITASLVAGGFLRDFKVPLWVMLGSGLFMALGTFYGGHSVIKTLGRRIYKINSFHGFCAESSSAIIILFQSLIGIPLSTTQVISSAVMGVGAIERRAGVNWRKVIEIFFTWVFTIPGAALISGFLFWIFRAL